MKEKDLPVIREMIVEAIGQFGREFSNVQVLQYIKERWGNVNKASIRAAIITMTVNHSSRIHYTLNKKPRFTNSKSPYDILYRSRRGQLERYDEKIHGVWEIVKNDSGNYDIALIQGDNEEMIYTPSDIKWVKNITNKEIGTAYLDLAGDSFILHFPTHHKGNVTSPKIDEIILLHQKINGVSCLTHLVSPVDNELLENDEREDYKYGRLVKIIAITPENNVIPIDDTLWNEVNFSGISMGNACEIASVASVQSIEELQLDTWDEFREYFVEDMINVANLVDTLLDEIGLQTPEYSAEEGKLRLVSHYAKERNRKLIAEKKRVAVAEGNLKCEVCDFSFEKVYGSSFIECHHLFPIGSSGIRRNSLEDLALVCSNCHRMLHVQFEQRYLSIKELSQKINNA
jgi:5-methylcytosine-specific restriction protein A